MPVTRGQGRIVLALGGNAISPGGKGGTAAEQSANIAATMRVVAELIAGGLQIVLTHGNGPQVGNLLLKNDLARDIVPAMPLDWCVAQTQATIGFTMVTTLEEELAARGLPIPVIAVLSRILVDAGDPGFDEPIKPIGGFLGEAEARQRMEQTGQRWVRQGDKGWRRVVPSPEPLALLDAMSMRLVLDGGAVLIANGGGGIPMVRDRDGRLSGIEAVIDKDLAATLLATELGAERLVMLTDVEGVAVDYSNPGQRWLGEVSVAELAGYADDGQFAAGSMGPKVTAALRFVTGSGVPGGAAGGHGAVRGGVGARDRVAAIGALDEAGDVIAGRAGTQVHRA